MNSKIVLKFIIICKYVLISNIYKIVLNQPLYQKIHKCQLLDWIAIPQRKIRIPSLHTCPTNTKLDNDNLSQLTLDTSIDDRGQKSKSAKV